ncbi:hypothetical protein F2P56_019390 [Juglans regia]|uniref:Major antigen n=2 Tax=Juglans regia TaxID=51240 RepID=A0A2I4G424_JUGRE|nr:major antigen [Juglans regia]KAF5463481.1 hypothetical protein F2P56_019390 [Juglans regia]
MAKTKVTRQAKDDKEAAHQPQDGSQNQRAKPMDDPSEKLQSLKSLNSLLLKETFERRQQVESLEQAKESLEAELTLSGMEKKVLEAELIRATEESVGLELEKYVVCTFSETQMDEMGVGYDGLLREKGEIEILSRERESEIEFLKKVVSGLMTNLEDEREKLSRVYQERDFIKTEIDGLAKEANKLREKVVEMEKKERKAVEEVEKLKRERERLVKENLEIEKAVEDLKREKESVERDSEELKRVIETLKIEIEGFARERAEVEREKSDLEVKIVESEKEVRELSETVMNLRMEDEVLNSKVLELEKRIGEAVDKEKEMAMEINFLAEETREKERNIEKLKEERDSFQRILDMTSKESEFRQQRIEELIREKNVMEELKLSQESEIVELNTEVDRLKNVVSTLRDSCRNEENNKQLISEVSLYKDAFDRVRPERDELQKGFEEENKKVKNMEVLILEKEKKIKETAEELGRMRSEQENLIEKNKAIENHLEVLVKEKDLVQKNLVEAQRGVDDLKAKMESAGINSELALSMVKNTAALVCNSQGDGDGKKDEVIHGQKVENEIQPYAMELDAIKSAFRSKEKMVEDMKKQLGFLQNSVAEAHKQKSFWTLVSSATTIFAAASVAYVARGR